MKPWLLLVLLFSALSGQGQWTTNQYQLTADPLRGHLSGTWTLQGPFPEGHDSVVVEFWPLGLIHPGSSYRTQRLEEQKTDLHFSRREAAGRLDSLICTINGQRVWPEPNAHPDVLILKVAPGTPIRELRIQFGYVAPDSRFQGWGRQGPNLILRNALPMVAAFDQGAYHPAPLRHEEDHNRLPQEADVELTIPPGWDALVPAETAAQTEGTWRFKTLPTRSLPIWMAPVWIRTPALLNDTLLNATWIQSPDHLEDLNRYHTLLQQVLRFYQQELLWTPRNLQVVIHPNTPWWPSGNMVSIPPGLSDFKAARLLAQQIALLIFADEGTAAGFDAPWMTKGLAAYYTNRFVEVAYPHEKLLGWVSETFAARFFAIDAYPWDYQNQLYYLYMARQGLDQPIATRSDSLARFNYRGMAEGKMVMSLEYLRDYAGASRMTSGIRAYLQAPQQTPATLQSNLETKSYRKLDWFFGDLLYTNKKVDYSIAGYATCPTVTTLKLKNKGNLAIPFPVTGVIKDSAVTTEWYPGFLGKKTIPIYPSNYTKIYLDKNQHIPEIKQSNNQYKPGFLQFSNPLKLQFFTSFEDPRRTQLFWTPVAQFNAYDLFLLGVAFYNNTIVPKPFEFRLAPTYSTGTQSLTGSGSVLYNWVPKQGVFHKVNFGLFGRYNHYDVNLAYWRLSPTVNFLFRRSYPRSEDQHSIRLRLVYLDRETRPGQNPSLTDINRAAFTIFNLRYKWENASILKPFTILADYQLAESFSKLAVEADFRRMLPNRQWAALRLFAGTFLTNRNPDLNTYYNFGLSGTLDYLFDFYLIGRSDTEGIWSKQFFVSDGGFKSFADLDSNGVANRFSSTWMVGVNANLPVWWIFGLYGDVGLVPQIGRPEMVNLVAGAGIRIAIVPDFAEIFLPLVHTEYNPLRDLNPYWQGVRFVLNLEANAIVNRWRRGRF
jgi:hypothetical protein